MFKIAWSPIYAHPLPEGHRFPMEIYDLVPGQLVYEEVIGKENLFEPEQCPEEAILRAHDEEYWNRLKDGSLSEQEIRKSGFPYSEQLIIRESTIMEGTRKASDYALVHGCSMNIAGGTHHAYRSGPEGFCLLNDLAIAAYFLLEEKGLERILIVDLDVHQGNGTAKIFENDPRVFTFSMHGEKNYPFHKERSDLDIELKDGTEDKDYLHILEENINRLMKELLPDFVLFQSGVDVLETDQLGRLNLSMQGCAIRDRIVLESCQKHGIPITASMGGGYSKDINLIVEAHCNTFRIAQEVFFEI